MHEQFRMFICTPMYTVCYMLRYMLHVTRYTLHVTLHATCYTSHVTLHVTLHATCYNYTLRYMSHSTYMSHGTLYGKFSNFTCEYLRVITRGLSRVCEVIVELYRRFTGITILSNKAYSKWMIYCRST